MLQISSVLSLKYTSHVTGHEFEIVTMNSVHFFFPFFPFLLAFLRSVTKNKNEMNYNVISFFNETVDNTISYSQYGVERPIYSIEL